MSRYSLIPLPPNVTNEMLEANYWLSQISDPHRLLLTPEAVVAFNRSVHNTLGLPPVLDLPDTLSLAEVQEQIAQYQPPPAPCYSSAGELLGAAYFQTLVETSIPHLNDPVLVRFGLAIQRANVRSFPTDGVITSEPFEFDLDRIQETAIDAGWPVAVVATSPDGQWSFCLTPLYWGWVRAEAIALGKREQVLDFVCAEPFVTTVASRGMVALDSGGCASSQMGTRLPLREEKPHAYRLSIPTRRRDGTLLIVNGFAAKRANHFAQGYLPCTWETIFTQAFSLLGEPYAWGDSRMGVFGRDCSRFIRDIHAVTGIILPRNADQQENACVPVVTFERELADAEREKRLLGEVPPGAILAMPGHIMLYLGQVDGEPYVIHDTSSNGYSNIIVSDLSLGTDSPSGSLLRRITTAVTIAAGSG